VIQEYAVSRCPKCGGQVLTKIIGWDDNHKELVMDLATSYCKAGCALYALDSLTIIEFIEVES
jgi:hypothetical protein